MNHNNSLYLDSPMRNMTLNVEQAILKTVADKPDISRTATKHPWCAKIYDMQSAER